MPTFRKGLFVSSAAGGGGCNSALIVNQAASDQSNPGQPRSLQNLLDAVGSTTRVIEFCAPGSYNIAAGASMEVPPNVTLRFQPGAVLALGAGASINIFGQIDAGPGQQIFDADPGQVRLQANDSGATYRVALVEEVYPQWWGAGVDASGTVNQVAFQAAIVAFPFRVFVPAGEYTIKGQLLWDIVNDQPDLQSGSPFEFAGAGRGFGGQTVLAQDPTSTDDDFLSFPISYPTKFWQFGKLHGFSIRTPKLNAVKLGAITTDVYDLCIFDIPDGGSGIFIDSNSQSNHFLRVYLVGTPLGSVPCDVVADLDVDPSVRQSGIKCPGGNVATNRITDCSGVRLDVGINMYSSGGGSAGWVVENCDFELNAVGIALKAPAAVGALEFCDFNSNYMELSVNGCWGIRMSPTGVLPSACRIIGGGLTVHALNTLAVEVHGYNHVVDTNANIYGVNDGGDQFRFSPLIGPAPACP